MNGTVKSKTCHADVCCYIATLTFLDPLEVKIEVLQPQLSGRSRQGVVFGVEGGTTVCHVFKNAVMNVTYVSYIKGMMNYNNKVVLPYSGDLILLGYFFRILATYI